MFFTAAIKRNQEHYDVANANMKEIYELQSRHQQKLQE
jgi:hypothetical protein